MEDRYINRERWEYKTERISSTSTIVSDKVIETLNMHGSSGWEVASILPLDTGKPDYNGFEVFFKRKTSVPSLNPLCL